MPEYINYDSLFAYLTALLHTTSVYTIFRRVAKYARRFLLVTRVIRYVGIAVTFIETSAMLIVFSIILLSLVPIFILALAVLSAADFFIGTRLLKSELLAELVTKKRIVVIFENENRREGFARSLLSDDHAVIVVSGDPSLKFITYRSKNGILYIRHAFFYRLKRRVFKKTQDRIVYVL